MTQCNYNFPKLQVPFIRFNVGKIESTKQVRFAEQLEEVKTIESYKYCPEHQLLWWGRHDYQIFANDTREMMFQFLRYKRNQERKMLHRTQQRAYHHPHHQTVHASKRSLEMANSLKSCQSHHLYDYQIQSNLSKLSLRMQNINLRENLKEKNQNSVTKYSGIFVPQVSRHILSESICSSRVPLKKRMKFTTTNREKYDTNTQTQPVSQNQQGESPSPFALEVPTINLH
mmetsp:Transcript_19930/g.25795  ORF Transcript_19930/g.25795 Transcript_19930/m.25795 type:complete len:229 (+) Transcript_19930:107-793(+)